MPRLDVGDTELEVITWHGDPGATVVFAGHGIVGANTAGGDAGDRLGAKRIDAAAARREKRLQARSRQALLE